MGPCVAGGAYLPVMCDKYIIVEGASMFLAGPALVKAAIGQEIDQDTLGGASTHTAISGTADYYAKDDLDGLNRIKNILKHINFENKKAFNKSDAKKPKYAIGELLGIFNPLKPGQYDMHEIMCRVFDEDSFDEYKQNYGKTLICGTATLGGYSIGVVANQKIVQKSTEGEMQMGGVIYSDSADKAARFVMNCNQDRIPILFIHDVNGFMVGKDAEWGGIAKDGAKLVNAVSNSIVPKITLIIGGSYGAGNYAMSGRAYQPRFMFSWASSKLAVMGGAQAAKTMTDIKISKMGKLEQEQIDKIFNDLKDNYDKQSDPRYAAARLWTDMIINPIETRDKLIYALDIINNQDKMPAPRFGVLQV
jgi:3-methylcrotonyl-CoA carboxylase beta subunit